MGSPAGVGSWLFRGSALVRACMRAGRRLDGMDSMKLISWNVNGLRAVLKKNFLEYLGAEQPDILCVQETKAAESDVDPVWPSGYEAHWNSAEKKGYSGTLILTRVPPMKVSRGMGIAEHDREGRVLAVEYPEFHLVNVYTPNSQRELARLPYRMAWDEAFRAFLSRLGRTKPVVFCGDLNVAHTEIDLANPKANVRNHGFTVEERGGFTALLESGFVDTFREFEKGGGHYTWWSPMGGARARNVGWRIDYFMVSGALRKPLKSAFIRRDVPGSDHCPVGIELKFGKKG